MSSDNYSVAYDGSYTTLSARIKGKFIPLISSEDKLQVECIYQNILAGTYKSARELCEDIYNIFSIQATLLVRVTLLSTTHLSTKA